MTANTVALALLAKVDQGILSLDDMREILESGRPPKRKGLTHRAKAEHQRKERAKRDETELDLIRSDLVPYTYLADWDRLVLQDGIPILEQDPVQPRITWCVFCPRDYRHCFNRDHRKTLGYELSAYKIEKHLDTLGSQIVNRFANGRTRRYRRIQPPGPLFNPRPTPEIIEKAQIHWVDMEA